MRATSRRRTMAGEGPCGTPPGVPPTPLTGLPLSTSALRTPPPCRPPDRRVPPARGLTVERDGFAEMLVIAPAVPPMVAVRPEASPSEPVLPNGARAPLPVAGVAGPPDAGCGPVVGMLENGPLRVPPVVAGW